MQSSSLPASLLRQYAFCPRIPFFKEILGVESAMPLWVRQGTNLHVSESKLIKNRRLQVMGIENPLLHFDCELSAGKLPLHGKADLILEGATGIVVVEIKMNLVKAMRGQVLQLVAYGMLAEEKFNKPLLGAFFLSDRKPKIREVKKLELYRDKVSRAVTGLQRLIGKGVLPESPASVEQCGQCEFLNLCNDRF